MGRRIFTTVCLVLLLMVGSAAAGWAAAPPGRATIEVFPRTASELAAADDLRSLGEWAVESRALDYLDRDVIGVQPR